MKKSKYFTLNFRLIKALSITTIIIAIEILLICCLFYLVSVKIINMQQIIKPNVYLENYMVGNKTMEEAEDFLKDLENKYLLKPRNATLGGKEIIFPEQRGKTINITETMALLKNATSSSRVEPVIIALEPEITGLELQGLDEIWGHYITYYGGGDRGENIKIAANHLNNTLLPPGQVFSFNKTIGPITEEKGYTFAPIIVGDEVVPGRGGGICQVSSTLYNAVLQAELEIVERYPHSMPVDYVPPGRDATVSEYLDFKFRNTTDSYIIIKAVTNGTQCMIEIWGS